MKVRRIISCIILSLLLCLLSIDVFAGTLKLNESSVDLSIGGKCSLKVTGKPKNSMIKWCSNNPNVATVTSKGKVKAVGKGEAEIYAYMSDGSSISSPCYVTVNGKKKIKTTNVTITNDNWGEYIERIHLPYIIYNEFGDFKYFGIRVIYTVKTEYIKKLIPAKSYFVLEHTVKLRNYYLNMDESNVSYNLMEPFDTQDYYELIKDRLIKKDTINSRRDESFEIIGIDIHAPNSAYKYNMTLFHSHQLFRALDSLMVV